MENTELQVSGDKEEEDDSIELETKVDILTKDAERVHESPSSETLKCDQSTSEMSPDSKPDSTDDRNLCGSEEGELTELSSDALKSFESHPLKFELEHFESTDEQLRIEASGVFKTLDETPLHYVQDKEELDEAIESLKAEKEVAIDLEYSDHGYIALTCLIQLSTLKADYIIDAITLKKHVSSLSEILSDKNIVKIFHASSNDLKWLQQDFKLFVINMFDTQFAMKTLGYKNLGLHSELQKYNIIKDRAMQRADFRLRPLPKKYLEYARTDSHFLINIYRNLKNKLMERGLLKHVLTQCNNKCKIVYGDPEDSCVSIRKSLQQMHTRQLNALDKINEWRHGIAEDENVNPGTILSKKNLGTLATELPLDSARVLNICGNSPHVRKDIGKIMEIICEAKPQYPHKKQNVVAKTFQSRDNKRGSGNPNRFNNRKRKLQYSTEDPLDNNPGPSFPCGSDATDLRSRLQHKVAVPPRFDHFRGNKRQRQNFRRN